ncbi:MAG: hypothetical protein QM765_49450 [Myxococcales bacterium]
MESVRSGSFTRIHMNFWRSPVGRFGNSSFDQPGASHASASQAKRAPSFGESPHRYCQSGSGVTGVAAQPLPRTSTQSAPHRARRDGGR